MVRREKIKVLWLKPKKGQVSIDRAMIADNLSANYEVSVMEVSISRIPHIIMNLALSSGGGGRNTLARRALWQGYSKTVIEEIAGNVDEERNYVKNLIRRVGSRVSSPSFENIMKSFTISVFTLIAGVGYIWQIF